MDMTHTYWEDIGNNSQRCNAEESNRLKEDRGMYPCCDTNLNFSTATCSEDDCEYGSYKKNKVTRQDPMSHRIIEKRRRDRMNNCLADLSRLIPTEYLKKGRGRIEKTEIIEMAIKHMKYLQQEHMNPSEHYRLGYQECMSETMRYMVEVEGHFPREAICVRLLSHLQKHCDSISRTPQVSQQVPHNSEQISMPHPQELVRNSVPLQSEYPVPKSEPEPNNNTSSLNGNACSAADIDYEKHAETNGVLYKYKTNIKLRFNQDTNGGQEMSVKRPKLENERRNSNTSTENHSLSHSSPPSSEICTRISDAETVHIRSPSDSTVSTSNNLKMEQPSRGDIIQRFSPSLKNPTQNFNIPIFVLHAKGSYYVPLTIDYKTLMPFLQNYNILDGTSTIQNVVLHPVTINVNFQPNFNQEVQKYKTEFNNWH